MKALRKEGREVKTNERISDGKESLLIANTIRSKIQYKSILPVFRVLTLHTIILRIVCNVDTGRQH